jgi:hypothetical protein
MSCAACDSLAAKKKTCWRHPAQAEAPQKEVSGSTVGSLSGFLTPSWPGQLPIGTILEDVLRSRWEIINYKINQHGHYCYVLSFCTHPILTCDLRHDQTIFYTVSPSTLTKAPAPAATP